MPSMIFESCCGCIGLRSGCLILGYLQLFSISFTIGKCLVELLNPPKELEEALEGTGFSVQGVAAIYLLILGVFLGFNITFLVGLRKNKRGYVLAYLIFTTITNVLAAIFMFVVIIISQTYQIIIPLLIFVGINAYFLMVIRSHYYKMDETNIRDGETVQYSSPSAAVPYHDNTVQSLQ